MEAVAGWIAVGAGCVLAAREAMGFCGFVAAGAPFAATVAVTVAVRGNSC